MDDNISYLNMIFFSTLLSIVFFISFLLLTYNILKNIINRKKMKNYAKFLEENNEKDTEIITSVNGIPYIIKNDYKQYTVDLLKIKRI